MRLFTSDKSSLRYPDPLEISRNSRQHMQLMQHTTQLHRQWQSMNYFEMKRKCCRLQTSGKSRLGTIRNWELVTELRRKVSNQQRLSKSSAQKAISKDYRGKSAKIRQKVRRQLKKTVSIGGKKSSESTSEWGKKSQNIKIGCSVKAQEVA